MTRRLGGGSGWIRVNLDLGFAFKNDQEEFDFDFSDTLVEPDGDVYTSNFDDNSLSSDDRGKASNRKWEGLEEGRAVRWDNLERAVLIPNQEASLHLPPSQEKIEERREEEGKEEVGVRELEAGLGALLSLLSLFAVLFLANCLPCALRDRRKAMREDDEEMEPGGGIKEVEQKEVGRRLQEVKKEEDEEIKEVEIIC